MAIVTAEIIKRVHGKRRSQKLALLARRGVSKCRYMGKFTPKYLKEK